MTRIFLTGAPGCGKSTVVEKVLKELKRKRLKIAGILTPEIRKDAREGFEIIDITSGHREIMAAVGIKSKFKVSKYGVDVPAIERVLEKFEASFKAADIIVLDEIGKMEYCSEKFKKVLQEILKSKKPLLATVGRHLVPEFKKYGEIITVTKGNREALPAQLLKALI